VDAEAAPCPVVRVSSALPCLLLASSIKPDEEAAVALLSFKSARSQPTTSSSVRKDAILLPEIQSN
jgi:hypothetical protein